MTRVIRVHEFGGPEALVAESVPDVAPGAGEIRRVESLLGDVQIEHDGLLAVLGDADTYADTASFDAAMRHYTEVKRQLAALEAEWLVLTDTLEGLESEA